MEDMSDDEDEEEGEEGEEGKEGKRRRRRRRARKAGGGGGGVDDEDREEEEGDDLLPQFIKDYAYTGPLLLAVFVAMMGSFQFGYNSGVINVPEKVKIVCVRCVYVCVDVCVLCVYWCVCCGVCKPQIFFLCLHFLLFFFSNTTHTQNQ